jgi:hypothetical protein
MVAMFIVSSLPQFICVLSVIYFQGEIGVLDRADMDHFAGILIAYQKLGKCTKPKGQSK